MTLHITVGFEKGAKFIFYNEDGSVWTDENDNPIECTAHDTAERTWRHLDFFQYETYIHAKMPKVSDGQAPWARKNSGFTLLFEGWVMELAKQDIRTDFLSQMCFITIQSPILMKALLAEMRSADILAV